MSRIHIPKPTASEVEAVLKITQETESVGIAKPVYDFLLSKLHKREVVSKYISDKIKLEIVRVYKLKPVGKPHHSQETVKRITKQRVEVMRKQRESGERVIRDTARVRVFDGPYDTYMDLSENKQDRTVACGGLIKSRLESIDRATLVAYCKSHDTKPSRFISVPTEALAAARVIACDLGVPTTKLVNYILATA